MRAELLFNNNWVFYHDNGTVESIDIPHTWNGIDGQDGGNNYFRGTCRYEKQFACPEFDRENERVYVQFAGVNASSEVWLNGTRVIAHDGGYSTFRADITDLLQEENMMTVSVDNSVNDTVYPQKGRLHLLRRYIPRCEVADCK